MPFICGNTIFGVQFSQQLSWLQSSYKKGSHAPPKYLYAFRALRVFLIFPTRFFKPPLRVFLAVFTFLLILDHGLSGYAIMRKPIDAFQTVSEFCQGNFVARRA
jgi:hypothetical protein